MPNRLSTRKNAQQQQTQCTPPSVDKLNKNIETCSQMELLSSLLSLYTNTFISHNDQKRELNKRVRKYENKLIKDIQPAMFRQALTQDTYGRTLFLIIWKGSLKEICWSTALPFRKTLTEAGLSPHNISNIFTKKQALSIINDILQDRMEAKDKLPKNVIHRISFELEYQTGYNLNEFEENHFLVEVFSDEIAWIVQSVLSRYSHLPRWTTKLLEDIKPDWLTLKHTTIRLTSRNIHSLKAGNRVADCTRVGQFNHWAVATWEVVFENIGLEITYKGKLLSRVIGLIGWDNNYHFTFWAHGNEFSPLVREKKSVFSNFTDEGILDIQNKVLHTYCERVGITSVWLTPTSNSFGLKNILESFHGILKNRKFTLVDGMRSGLSTLYSNEKQPERYGLPVYLQGWEGSTQFGLGQGANNLNTGESIFLNGKPFDRKKMASLSVEIADIVRKRIELSKKRLIDPMAQYTKRIVKAKPLLKNKPLERTKLINRIDICSHLLSEYIKEFDPGNQKLYRNILQLSSNMNSELNSSINRTQIWRKGFANWFLGSLKIEKLRFRIRNSVNNILFAETPDDEYVLMIIKKNYSHMQPDCSIDQQLNLDTIPNNKIYEAENIKCNFSYIDNQNPNYNSIPTNDDSNFSTSILFFREFESKEYACKELKKITGVSLEIDELSSFRRTRWDLEYDKDLRECYFNGEEKWNKVNLPFSLQLKIFIAFYGYYDQTIDSNLLNLLAFALSKKKQITSGAWKKYFQFHAFNTKESWEEEKRERKVSKNNNNEIGITNAYRLSVLRGLGFSPVRILKDKNMHDMVPEDMEDGFLERLLQDNQAIFEFEKFLEEEGRSSIRNIIKLGIEHGNIIVSRDQLKWLDDIIRRPKLLQETYEHFYRLFQKFETFRGYTPTTLVKVANFLDSLKHTGGQYKMEKEIDKILKNAKIPKSPLCL